MKHSNLLKQVHRGSQMRAPSEAGRIASFVEKINCKLFQTLLSFFIPPSYCKLFQTFFQKILQFASRGHKDLLVEFTKMVLPETLLQLVSFIFHLTFFDYAML